MATYYVNRNQQSNGDHEVHAQGCNWLPLESNRIYLGEFSNCKQAVAAARAYYTQVNGCYFCSPSCHTQ